MCAGTPFKKKKYGTQQTGGHKKKCPLKAATKNVMYPEQKASVVVEGLLPMGPQNMVSVHLTDDDSDGDGGGDDDDSDGYGI